jgi:hypothetical protein
MIVTRRQPRSSNTFPPADGVPPASLPLRLGSPIISRAHAAVQIAVVITSLMLLGRSAVAQLISPGKLSAVHGEWGGIRNCTQCHELRKRGVANERCLDCHAPLAARIDDRRGFHATVADQGCADCHKEHLGPDFDIQRLDVDQFDHNGQTGFALVESHAKVDCQDCHNARLVLAPDVRDFKGRHDALDDTYLGLGAVCLDCHQSDAPHRDQFPDQPCDACHTQIQWEEARGFNHDESTYRLEGGHRRVDCVDCHPTVAAAGEPYVQYKPLAFATCLSCHKTDKPHRDQFPNRSCDDCHTQLEWVKPTGFDHDDSRYRITGAHRRVECAECHRTTTEAGEPYVEYRPLAFATCLSCHEDEHEGSFDRDCTKCHTTDEWTRVNRSTVEREFDHRTTDFELVGRHASAECTVCHTPSASPGPDFAITYEARTLERAYPKPIAETCLSCHVDYHEDVFTETPGGPACDNCHGQTEWIPTTYDIGRHNGEADFRLDGAHIAAPCTTCHNRPSPGSEAIRFRFVDRTCVTCHATDDPHRGQFEDRACTKCHDTETFSVTDFEHDDTRFPLEGAHLPVLCDQCHTQEVSADGAAFRRYQPVPTQCQECHGGRS